MKLFLDNNLAPRIARSLNALFDGEHHIVALRDMFRRSASDIEWITALDQQGGWAALTRDLRLLQPLRRFVIGNGKTNSGYVLSHPKIAEYLQHERFSGRSFVLRKGFASWGQKHLRELNSGEMAPKDASPYALQYLRAHFEDAGLPAHDWMEFVENGWRCAWDQFEAGPEDLQATCELRGMLFGAILDKRAQLERNGAARSSSPRSEASGPIRRPPCLGPRFESLCAPNFVAVFGVGPRTQKKAARWLFNLAPHVATNFLANSEFKFSYYLGRIYSTFIPY